MVDDHEDVALTRRRGPPVTPLLLLRSVCSISKGHYELVALDGTVITISDHQWSAANARLLHRWIVRAPKWMVPGDALKPKWLCLHAPDDATFGLVRRDDGVCCFDGSKSAMNYDCQLGLYAARLTQPTLRYNDDDEFDN